MTLEMSASIKQKPAFQEEVHNKGHGRGELDRKNATILQGGYLLFASGKAGKKIKIQFGGSPG